MAKGIFVTGTGTDVGKTYVTALIVKKLADAGIHAGYYKAALSGAESIEESDAGYVKKIAGITQEDSSLLSYLYQNAVSPHLAARIEGNPVDPETVKADFDRVKREYDYEYAGDRRCRTWHDQCGCPDGRIHPESRNGCKRNHSESLLGWGDAGR